MFRFNQRVKANSGWVGRVYVHDGRVLVYREGLLDSFPVDELVLAYKSSRPRRDVKRVKAGIRANVVELRYGTLNLRPRLDRELQSPEELQDRAKRSASFWHHVRRQQDARRAERMSGGLDR